MKRIKLTLSKEGKIFSYTALVPEGQDPDQVAEEFAQEQNAILIIISIEEA